MDHRSATWNLTADLMAGGGSDTPIHSMTESRCKICAAPQRDVPNGAAIKDLVDDMIMLPRDYTAIMRIVEPLMVDWPEDLRFSRFGLMRHARRHLRWEQTAFRAVADRRAREVAKVQGASDRMIDAVVVYETIRQRGLDLMLEGEIRPTVRDMLAATSALQEIEEQASDSFSPAVLLSQLDEVIQVIREEIPEARWPVILARIEGEPSDPLPSAEPDPVWEEILAEAGDPG